MEKIFIICFMTTSLILGMEDKVYYDLPQIAKEKVEEIKNVKVGLYELLISSERNRNRNLEEEVRKEIPKNNQVLNKCEEHFSRVYRDCYSQDSEFNC